MFLKFRFICTLKHLPFIRSQDSPVLSFLIGFEDLPILLVIQLKSIARRTEEF